MKRRLPIDNAQTLVLLSFSECTGGCLPHSLRPESATMKNASAFHNPILFRYRGATKPGADSQTFTPPALASSPYVPTLPAPATRTAQTQPLAVYFQLQSRYGCCSTGSENSYNFIRHSYEQSASADTKHLPLAVPAILRPSTPRNPSAPHSPPSNTHSTYASAQSFSTIPAATTRHGHGQPSNDRGRRSLSLLT